ncbi:MAG: DUF2062 domain-containing protein [Archangium sp.]|nr:DUF2062 domain-containing protein [Archangium sp.]
MFRRRIIEPLKNQLKQGVTPGKLALALALGLVIGSVPILFVTSLLCALVAYVFKLNQPAIQVANYVAYPLQLALFIPFFKAGAAVFGESGAHFSLEQIQSAFSADASRAIGTYAGANLRAVSVWAVIAPLAVVVIFFALKFLLSRVRLPAREA